MSLVRIDPITSKPVIFTTKRENRPRDLWKKDFFKLEENFNSYEEECPFCKGNEDKTPEERLNFPEEDWKVSIVRNKFPIISDDRLGLTQNEYSYITSGVHDVIVESDLHYKTYFNMEKSEFEFLYEKIKLRYVELMGDDTINLVSFFKNYQIFAGASLYHPHSQMMSMTITSDILKKEIEGSKEYQKKTGKCPYCHVVENQLKNKDRLVIENKSFISIEPFAAGQKFETWIIPKNHNPYFEKEDNIKDLGDIIYKTFKMLYNTMGNFPYNFYLHSSPKNIDNTMYYHYHFEIIPRVSGGAGFEMATGIRVNSLLPERALELIHKNN